MLRSLTRRRMAPVVVAAAAALVLTGCGNSSKDDTASDKASSSSTPSSSSSATDSPTDGSTTTPAAVKPCAVPTGGKSAGITVSGDFGKKDPKATFDKGLSSSKLERTVVTKGSKATTKKGDTLNVVITAYNGRTGKQVSSEAAKVIVGDATFPLSLDAGFDCVNIGSRVVTTFPSSDLYGDTGNVDLGIEGKDALVVVTDVVDTVKPLKPAAWNDAPKVTFKGKIPSFKLTGTPSPTLKMHVIKKGKGAVVGNGDTVTVNYYGVSWDTKKVFDESYSKTPASFAVTGVVQGFGAALAGQKAGTRLIVTMPPKYGYGEGKQNTDNLIGQTLVFVVDIISTKAP